MWFASPASDKPPTAVIVEDELALRDELCELLNALWPELRIVGSASNGVTALQLIAQHQPTIAFLDIQIPDPNGLEVARLIGECCHVVFVTAYDAHAVDAFERGALDYVLKPIGAERLALTVNRLKRKLHEAPPDMAAAVGQLQLAAAGPRHLRWITASVGNTLRLITIDEVVFFQSDQKYTRVVLADSEVLIRKTLRELLAELDPEQFWQLHRSTVVNALEIAGIAPDLRGQFTVRLKSRREQLPVSEAFLRRFRSL